MKNVKKLIRELRSSRDKFPSPDKSSDVPTTQHGGISNDSNQTGAQDVEALALEPQHGDSDELGELVAPHSSHTHSAGVPKVQTKFRILIIGRANAGKMTLLQRICKSTEYPEIYNRGKRVGPAIKGMRQRGIHDINNEMVFKSNRKFVFHDFPGFETGHEDEFEQMKQFLTERANMTVLSERIHAIWYCIPMDQIHRAITPAEVKFFQDCDTGNVPVVVLFTKYDALVTQAFQPEHLLLSQEDQQKVWKERSEEIFRKRDVWSDLCKMSFPPHASVQLQNLNKSDEGCSILLERTAAALKDGSLQMLLVSAQEKNI